MTNIMAAVDTFWEGIEVKAPVQGSLNLVSARLAVLGAIIYCVLFCYDAKNSNAPKSTEK